MEGIWQESGFGAGSDQGKEGIETERLCRALIEAGRTFKPLERAEKDVVFRRIVAQLQEDEKRGVPVARIERPSGLIPTGKLSS